MNDFYNEILEFAKKRLRQGKSALERNIWKRLISSIERTQDYPDSPNNPCPYKLALYASYIINNKSPFHNRHIQVARKIRILEDKKKLPAHLHNRMILATNNPSAKGYVEWINTKHKFYYPI